MGIGSSKHVDDLDERIREFSSGRSMGVKDSRSATGCGFQVFKVSSIYLSDAQKNRVRLGTEILRTRHRTTNYHSIT